MGALKANRAVAAVLPALERDVRDGSLIPTLAVDQIMGLMGL